MIALLLAESIASLFAIMLVGFVMAKSGVLDASAGKPLSNLLLYVFFPCAIVVSFEVDFDAGILAGLGVGFAAAAAIQLLQLALTRLLARPLGLDAVERCSAIYSNCGNLIIPIVVYILGDEWVIYSLGFICVNTALMFTHAKSQISGQRMYDLRSITLNPSIISISIGLILFATGLRLPGPLDAAISGLAAMLGPTAMLVAGIGIASAPLRETFAQRRVWLVVFLRLIALSLVSCLLLKAAIPLCPIPNAETILLITLLAAVAPCASFVVNFAAVYERDYAHASAINVVSNLCCIITMPAMVALYTL